MSGSQLDARHPDPGALRGYADRVLGPGSAAAVELHLQGCAVCRDQVNQRAWANEATRIETNLLAITAELDAPRHGVVERVLVRSGLPVDTVRLLVATPSLRRSWFIAIGLALFFGLAAANPDRPDSSLLWFLGLAPLIPVIGVALAYGPGVDPSYEITLATPISGVRLVLLRTTAVLVTSIGIAGAVTLLIVPRHSLMVGAWLLPALALSIVCLALMTVTAPRAAAVVVSGVWLVAIIACSGVDDQLVAFRPTAQLGFVAVGALAALVVASRRGTFDAMRGGGVS